MQPKDIRVDVKECVEKIFTKDKYKINVAFYDKN